MGVYLRSRDVRMPEEFLQELSTAKGVTIPIDIYDASEEDALIHELLSSAIDLLS